MKKKIIIIGAGPAGLAAAWKLTAEKNTDYEVCMLEQSDTVGGMAKTVLFHGHRMDIGGHRFYSKEKTVLQWWNHFFSDIQEASDLLLRERNTRILYKKQFFDYPITLNRETIKKLGIKSVCKVGIDYLKVCMKPQKEESLEQFYINRFGKELYRIFFEGYTQKICGVHPKEISSKWGCQRVKGLSIGAIVKQGVHKKGQQAREGLLPPSLFYYPKYGPGQMWERVAEQVVSNGADLILNCSVNNLHQNKDGKIDYVMVQTVEGEKKIEGDVILSSMPIRELVLGLSHSPIKIKKLAEKLPYRAFVTVGLCIDKINLDTKDCWIYIQDKRVKVCRIQFYDNWSPYLQKAESKHVYIALEYFCQEKDAFWNMTEEECVKFAIKEARILGILGKNAKIIDFHREQIAQAYPGYYGAYNKIDKVKAYLSEIENLKCIGRNGLHEYWNMDKCILSGWEAAEWIKKLNFSNKKGYNL